MFNLHITGLCDIDSAPLDCEWRVIKGIQRLIEKLKGMHVTEMTIVLNEVWGSRPSFQGKASFNRAKKRIDQAIKNFQTIQFLVVPGDMMSSAEVRRLYPSENNYLILNYAGSEINDIGLLNNLHFIEASYSTSDAEHEYIIALFEHIREDFTLDYFFHESCIQKAPRFRRIPPEARVEVDACIPVNRQYYQIMDRHPSQLILNPPCRELCVYTEGALIIRSKKKETLNRDDGEINCVSDIDDIAQVYRENRGGLIARLLLFSFSSHGKVIENMTRRARKDPEGASAKTLRQIL
ncbi:MAG: hypothetical protein V4496_06030 [Pseudomonadota bacterium]